MQGDIVLVLISLGWMAVLGIIVYYGLWFYGTLVEDEKNENKDTI